MTRTQTIHSPSKFKEGIRLVRKDGYSIRKAAKEISIPYNTLRDHINGTFKDHDTTFGPDRLLSNDQESSLVNYATFMASRGCPLTRPVLKKIAREIITQTDHQRVVKTNISTGPSNSWIRKFLKRNKNLLTLRTAHPLENSRVIVTQETLDEYFVLLKNTLNDLGISNDPTRIFNCDESGFSGKLNSCKKVIVPKGTKHAYQNQVGFSGHVTLLNSISAAGQTTPPMLIYSQCLPKSLKEGVPDTWKFRSSEKGYINTELFCEWFCECFVPYIGKKRPVLLILDNHITHLSKQLLDAAAKSNVDLLYLPAHSSHLCQPQDVGYFHVLKQKVADIAIELGYFGMKTLPRYLFHQILHQALNRITGNTVSAAFRCTGIYPLNANCVKALTPKSNQVASSATSVTPNVSTATDNATDTNLCQNCGTNKENMLVKLGLVSVELANVLVPLTVNNPKPTTSKASKRKYEKARAVCVTKEKKAPKSRKSKTVEIADEHLSSGIDDTDTTLCSVCMISSIDNYTWVGCDYCEKWFHYECLPSRIQCDVDLSLITGAKWKCCDMEE